MMVINHKQGKAANSLDQLKTDISNARKLADDIARQLEQLLHDSALRQQLVARGRQRALQFSWDDAASGVLQQCYEAVAA